MSSTAAGDDVRGASPGIVGPSPPVASAASASAINLQRRASAGSFRQSLQSLSKKKPGGKRPAPMSYIPGIRPPASRHHAKRFNGVPPKYGVQPTNADQLAEVRTQRRLNWLGGGTSVEHEKTGMDIAGVENDGVILSESRQ